MTPDHIKQMFIGIDHFTKDRIVKNLRVQLGDAIKGVNGKMLTSKLDVAQLSPQPQDIMAAFRACSLEQVQVVIIGQDPFINVGEATGLCFSVPVGKKVPPSTQNIYKCLMQSNLMVGAPAHGDLSHWAAQGILMLNAALTTILGKSNAHKDDWAAYTDGVISQVTALPQKVIFILLGTFAQSKKHLISEKDIILTWGHPSPASTANRGENPKHFKYCDVFTRTNELLIAGGKPAIIWDIAQWDATKYVAPVVTYAVVQPLREVAPEVVMGDATAIPTTFNPPAITGNCGLLDPIPPPGTSTVRTLFVFTDGGATANGRPNCVASWGFYMTDGLRYAKSSAQVEPKELVGCRFKSSNNRGELTAILRAIEYINANHADFGIRGNTANVIIISDSELSIKGIDERSADGKKNADLIIAAKGELVKLRNLIPVGFKHVNASHDSKVEPTDPMAKFIWKGNAVVDSLCNVVLGLDDNKKRI